MTISNGYAAWDELSAETDGRVTSPMSQQLVADVAPELMLDRKTRPTVPVMAVVAVAVGIHTTDSMKDPFAPAVKARKTPVPMVPGASEFVLAAVTAMALTFPLVVNCGWTLPAMERPH
jgi:hypothetical protein